jgi:sugar transferase EpsL
MLSRQAGIKLVCKIAVDKTISLLGIIVFSPVFLISSAVVFISMGRPVLFRQRRPGLRGRPFILYKFRTMSNGTNGDGNLLRDDRRLTRVGKIFRSLSLDELPQLWNVLRGDMSLVGPRPLLMEYLNLYTSDQARRHDVLPGITGWAQINGRNALAWEQKFDLDLWYVDNWTIALDAKILWRTLWKVFKRNSISYEGYATAPQFQGSSVFMHNGNDRQL